MSDEQLLAWIKEFLAKNHYAPTVREVADAMGKGSTTIHYRLKCLRGTRVEWNDGEVRTLRVLPRRKSK